MVLFFKILLKHDGERYFHGIPDAKVITPKKMNETFTALISSLHIFVSFGAPFDSPAGLVLK